ncbi:serine-threonine/tyrosine-protein kinase catalytic domain-containing protein [Tanacetum coccineum]
MYKAMVKCDKYCDKMLNRRALWKIINCDVHSRGKGPITLKLYREDGSDETIQNFKANDLHLGEWREVMNVCPNRIGAGWSTIYSQINQRMINLHKTKEELELDFSLPKGTSHQLSMKIIQLELFLLNLLWGEIVGSVPEPFSLSLDLNIKYSKCSLAKDSSTSILQVLRKSSSKFTSVYVAVQKLKKTSARASVHLGWQFQAERCRSPLRRLTCDGMLRAEAVIKEPPWISFWVRHWLTAYEHGVDNMNTHFELLRLDISPFDDKEDSFRTTERYEKVKRILQRFDINKDGCLNEEELTIFLSLVKGLGDEEELTENINIFCPYAKFYKGEKSLNCDGLFRVGYGINSLDVDFEKLCLNLKPLDETETTLSMYEKARRIFQRFDINGDGGLNREVTEFLVAVAPELKTNDETWLILYLIFLASIQMVKRVLLVMVCYTVTTIVLMAWIILLRYEKVKTIFQQYDLNGDGGIDELELAIFFAFKHPDNASPEELASYVINVSRCLDTDFERLLIDTTLTRNEAASRARDRLQ